MSDRQQQVKTRPRKPAPRKASGPTFRKRRSFNIMRWVRVALVLGVVALPFVGYYVAASSDAFLIRKIEVSGTKRTNADDVREAARKVAGTRLLGTNLEAVRASVAASPYVQSATVVRVLPDTLRVTLVEREPAVVVRLGNGRLAWADKDGHVLEEFKPERGVVPPPLSGFDDADTTDRAMAENRDRIATYAALQTALAEGDLWDRLDEVDIKYLKDVKVRLADNGVVVRLGDGDYRTRLITALSLLDAVKRGDTEMLARYRVPDIGKLLASADAIGTVDVTRSNGAVSIVISNGRSGQTEAKRN